MARRISNEEIITALFTTPTVKEAAAKLGIHQKTLYNRRQTEDFKKAYAEARSDILQGAVNKLQGKLNDAIDIIGEVMTDKEESAPQVRLNAANDVMRNYLRLVEHLDLTAEVEKLKEALLNE